MARSLNRSRIFASKVFGIVLFVSVIASYPIIKSEALAHEIFDGLGLFMVYVCALGRVYSTAYLGGSKNTKLIDYGPFSVVRNPLYFFSLIGFTGIAFMTNHLLLMIVTPIFFGVLYHRLMKREEGFLTEAFGGEYIAYTARVPRLLPNLSLWHDKSEIKLNTALFFKGIKDAVWWFAAFPFVELVEYLQEADLLHPLFLLP